MHSMRSTFSRRIPGHSAGFTIIEMLVVLAINFIGDWLRDALDVRQSL